MMICFNCTVETRDALDRLLIVGSYRDYGEVIAAAVRNQLLMEQQVVERGAIVIGGPESPSTVSRPPDPPPVTPTPPPPRHTVPTVKAPKTPPAPTKKAAPTPSSRGAVVPSSPAPVPTGPPKVPAIFTTASIPNEPPKGLAELPADMWAPGQTVPLDRWILGQHNRLLPAKVNARALMRLFADADKGLPIAVTAAKIAQEAASLGDYLASLDMQRETGRDDAFVTAFPTTAEEADKARARYANQFVAYENSKGELSGLMIDLKLINVVTIRKERFIVPTTLAWELARLSNPILDGAEGAVPEEKFSADERALLVRHIVTSVPVEAFAYRAILEAIKAGKNTPETIDATLKAYVAEERADKLSQSFLASQRSGAVSRMSDLNLVTRVRDGIRVSYALTENGSAFLDQSTPTR